MGNSKSRLTRTKKKPYKGPFPININLNYQNVRRDMEMVADGPTFDEITPIDTTQTYSENEGQEQHPIGGRPVKTSRKVYNWLGENIKGIVISVVATLFAGFCVRIAVTHSVELTSHQKDIEHISEEVSEHNAKIEKLQERVNNQNTNLLLLEQRVDIENESVKSKKNSK